jgi:hypothetical protein
MASDPTIICFLTVRPSKLFYDFCKLLQHDNYRVFITIDDPAYTIPEYDGVLPIINIPAAEAEAHGYKSTVAWFNNKACSRDKALYYFARVYTEPYKHIWFLEEDVFVPTTTTIPDLDAKYPDGDLLSASNEIVHTLRRDWWWPHISRQVRIPPPYGKSMICAIRVSPRLMSAIRDYAARYLNLFMDESFFNTMSIQAGLATLTPPELSTIKYQHTWKKSDINPTYLYHPIKSIETQFAFREK